MVMMVVLITGVKSLKKLCLSVILHALGHHHGSPDIEQLLVPVAVKQSIQIAYAAHTQITAQF